MKTRHTWSKVAVACIGLVLAATTLSACGDDSSASGSRYKGTDGSTKVTLRLGFTYSGAFAPLYYGVEQGYFKDRGIDLKILEGKGSSVTGTAVARGQDDFGYIDLSAAATLVDKGAKLKSISAVRQTTGMAVISRADEGLTEPKDLEGHSVSNTPGDSLGQLWPAFVAASGIDGNKVDRRGLDVSVYLQALKDKKIDAILGYSWYEGTLLKSQGLDVNEIKFADQGVNVFDYGVVAGDQLLKDEPKLVKAFNAAASESFEKAYADPAAAAAAGAKKFPQYDEDLAKIEIESYGDSFGEAAKGAHQIGWVSPEAWQKNIDLLVKYVGLKDSRATNYYTNDFLEEN